MSRSRLHLVGEAEATDRLSDDELMRLVKADCAEAFARLIRRHQRLVLGLATRYFHDSVVGRDVAQDVFLSLWAERQRYRPQSKFRAYLVSVVMHRCHVVARQGRSHRCKVERYQRQRSTGDDQAAQAPLRYVLEAERANQVRDKLTRLSAKQRAVIVLRYTHEMSLEEIAACTGEPLGTVKSHLFRGMKRLHRLLKKEAL